VGRQELRLLLTQEIAMNFKFTPTQRNMLSVAAQREDRCLEPLPSMDGRTVRTFGSKLIEAGFARELKARDGQPVWRHDKESDQNYALKLTASGMKVAAEQANAPEHAPSSRAAGLPQHPRPTSKLAKLIALLSHECGITIEDISKSMGWLPHTTRATLTGLRKRGISIIRETPDGVRNSIYRVENVIELTQAA
jgi:hypothetical protein